MILKFCFIRIIKINFFHKFGVSKFRRKFELLGVLE